jgi:transcriptional regulator with XRE-family HTH domain
MITGAQIIAARTLLGWTQSRLAGEVRVSQTTVSGFERGRKRPAVLIVSTIRSALEAAGVEFIAENGEGPGVRLRKAQ